MGTELLGGVMIGIMINDWLGRILFPGVVALMACGELFFLRRKRALPWILRKGMKSAGVSEKDIADTERMLGEMSETPFRESGLIVWKLYTWQFVWSFLTTLLIALLVGLIRDWIQ